MPHFPRPLEPGLSTTEEIVDALRAGEIVIIADDADRENEGDLLVAAEHATPDAINFMARHGRGLICLTLTEAHCGRLRLPQMAAGNSSPHRTAFTVSIDAADGISTGISAADRAHTIQVAIAADAGEHHLVQPGHVFPLRAVEGGVLARRGHTEAGCDLARLAGLEPAAVICEIMSDDGTMARMPELRQFARKHGLKLGTIADLVAYRIATESALDKGVERSVITAFGPFHAVLWRDRRTGASHLSLSVGRWRVDEPVVCRALPATSPLDVVDLSFGGERSEIVRSLQEIARVGRGLVVITDCLTGRADTAAGAASRFAPWLCNRIAQQIKEASATLDEREAA